MERIGTAGRSTILSEEGGGNETDELFRWLVFLKCDPGSQNKAGGEGGGARTKNGDIVLLTFDTKYISSSNYLLSYIYNFVGGFLFFLKCNQCLVKLWRYLITLYGFPLSLYKFVSLCLLSALQGKQRDY